MTDRYLYGLSQHLRRFARREVITTSDGHRLCGAIDAAIETRRMALNAAIDRLIDGQPLLPEDHEVIALCESLVNQLRPQLRELERSIA